MSEKNPNLEEINRLHEEALEIDDEASASIDAGEKGTHQEIVEKIIANKKEFGGLINEELLTKYMERARLEEIEYLKEQTGLLGPIYKRLADAAERKTGIYYFTTFSNNFHCRLPGSINIRRSKLKKKLSDDMDEIINKQGINKDEIIQWHNDQNFYGITPEEKERRIKIVMRIFTELVKLGYKWREMCG